MAREWLPRILALAVTALAPFMAIAQEDDDSSGGFSPARSSLSVRSPLPTDDEQAEFTRARYEERSTRHGFEIKTPQFTILARTNRDDARALHEITSEAWEAASQWLDPLTQAHRRSEFARGTVMLVLGEEPRHDRNGAEERITHHGTQTLIQFDPASEDLSTPAEIVGAVHEAIAETLLHKTQLDERLPDWVCDGLAGYIGSRAAEQAREEGDETPGDRPAPQASRVWNRIRASQDALESDRRDEAEREEYAHQVRFLLTGEGGRFAVHFYDAAREAIAAADLERKLETREFPHKSHAEDPASEAIEAPFAELCERLTASYAAWRADPLTGTPLTTASQSDPATAQAEREMLVVLRLIRLVNERPFSGVRLKVTGLSKEGKPIAETPRRADRYLSLEDLFRKLVDERHPHSFLDAENNLVLPEDHEQIREILGLEERRYRPEWDGEHWNLTMRLDDGRTLRGRLEENADRPSRPLAKFEITALQTARKR